MARFVTTSTSDVTTKVIVVGDPGCGKTTLCKRLQEGQSASLTDAELEDSAYFLHNVGASADLGEVAPEEELAPSKRRLQLELHPIKGANRKTMQLLLYNRAAATIFCFNGATSCVACWVQASVIASEDKEVPHAQEWAAESGGTGRATASPHGVTEAALSTSRAAVLSSVPESPLSELRWSIQQWQHCVVRGLERYHSVDPSTVPFVVFATQVDLLEKDCTSTLPRASKRQSIRGGDATTWDPENLSFDFAQERNRMLREQPGFVEGWKREVARVVGECGVQGVHFVHSRSSTAGAPAEGGLFAAAAAVGTLINAKLTADPLYAAEFADVRGAPASHGGRNPTLRVSGPKGELRAYARRGCCS